jgi:uncharacterized protein YjeT (DUF2065 family)
VIVAPLAPVWPLAVVAAALVLLVVVEGRGPHAQPQGAKQGAE